MRAPKFNLYEIVRSEHFDVKLMLVALGYPCERAGEAAEATIQQVYRDCAWEMYKRRARVGKIGAALSSLPPAMQILHDMNAVKLTFGGGLQGYWDGLISYPGTIGAVAVIGAASLGYLGWAWKQQASAAGSEVDDPDGYRDREVAKLTRARIGMINAGLRDAGSSYLRTLRHT